jgi:hypothetical protein
MWRKKKNQIETTWTSYLQKRENGNFVYFSAYISPSILTWI